jgi:cell division protein DivIC
MKLLSNVFGFVRNKYFIVSFLFLVWMLFFDPKDWGLIDARIEKLKDLQKSEKHLNNQITEARKELELLKTNAQTIEKYAREKYYMKKDNEDLFIVNSE